MYNYYKQTIHITENSSPSTELLRNDTAKRDQRPTIDDTLALSLHEPHWLNMHCNKSGNGGDLPVSGEIVQVCGIRLLHSAPASVSIDNDATTAGWLATAMDRWCLHRAIQWNFSYPRTGKYVSHIHRITGGFRGRLNTRTCPFITNALCDCRLWRCDPLVAHMSLYHHPPHSSPTHSAASSSRRVFTASTRWPQPESASLCARLLSIRLALWRSQNTLLFLLSTGDASVCAMDRTRYLTFTTEKATTDATKTTHLAIIFE